MSVELTCPVCDKVFRAKAGQKYCSYGCFQQTQKGRPRQRKIQPKPCENCGTLFQGKRTKQRFCSPKCARLSVGKKNVVPIPQTYDITIDSLERLAQSLPDGRGFFAWAAENLSCSKTCVRVRAKQLGYKPPKWEAQKRHYTGGASAGKRRALHQQPCVVCGETRVIQAAHIIARASGGKNDLANLMPLCPTHHVCYDRGQLNAAEWGTLTAYLTRLGLAAGKAAA